VIAGSSGRAVMVVTVIGGPSSYMEWTFSMETSMFYRRPAATKAPRKWPWQKRSSG
jgi:hypothetical protein